jgi:hypothetical protein
LRFSAQDPLQVLGKGYITESFSQRALRALVAKTLINIREVVEIAVRVRNWNVCVVRRFGAADARPKHEMIL